MRLPCHAVIPVFAPHATMERTNLVVPGIASLAILAQTASAALAAEGTVLGCATLVQRGHIK